MKTNKKETTESIKEEISATSEQNTENVSSEPVPTPAKNYNNPIYNTSVDDFIAQYEKVDSADRKESDRELATAIISAAVTFVLVVVVIITWFVLK